MELKGNTEAVMHTQFYHHTNFKAIEPQQKGRGGGKLS